MSWIAIQLGIAAVALALLLVILCSSGGPILWKSKRCLWQIEAQNPEALLKHVDAHTTAHAEQDALAAERVKA